MHQNYTMEYLKRQDFSIWRIRAKFLKNRLQRVKRTNRGGNYKAAMFAEYLQFMEVFLINYFIITEQDLLGNVFLSTRDMNKKIARSFFRRAKGIGLYIPDGYLTEFLSKYVLTFDETRRVVDLPELAKSYFFGLKASILDYARHRHFLNSYKHGYRFTMTGSSHYSEKIELDGNVVHRRDREFNSVVAYLHQSNGRRYNVHVSFDWRTPFSRIVLVDSILESARLSVISSQFPSPRRELYSVDKLFESFLLDEIIANPVPM